MVGIVIVILALSISCSQVEKSESSEEETMAEESFEEKMEELGDEYFKIGDDITIGELTFSLDSVRWEKRDALRTLTPEERQLVIYCIIKNTSAETISIAHITMFELYDSEGNVCKEMLFSPNLEGILDGKIDSGKEMRGEIAFAVRKDHSKWILNFMPELLGFENVAFLINEADISSF